MSNVYGLDFETFSEVNLPLYGADNYRRHESFEPLCATLVYPDGVKKRYNFVEDHEQMAVLLNDLEEAAEQNAQVACHNVGFERGVIDWMTQGQWTNMALFVDSAVMARMLGAGSRLAVASRQLTNAHKMEAGSNLMALFCWPHDDYVKPDWEYIQEHYAEEWEEFFLYCDVDAEGSKEIVDYGIELLTDLCAEDIWPRECELELLTYQQNRYGWKVDTESLEWMAKRSWANSEIAKAQFIASVGKELNFKSPQQLKKFAEERGVKYTSLDKYHAPIVYEEVVELFEQEQDPEQKEQYREVMTMLEIKLEIGGSTLTKIPTIQNRVDDKDVVHDVYVHSGAGQSFRTTSLGVQMQNLAKLSGEIRDLETLKDYSAEWSNTDMASQFRQVFTAHDPEGELIVGDFSAVESRGLAFLAGEQWKLDAYEKKMDVYKVLVTKYNNISYEEVTTEMRPKGKYTELSCGYQAGGKAVKDLMLKYGFRMQLEETTEWVTDWRAANPAVTQLWKDLDDLLKRVVASRTERTIQIANGLQVRMIPFQLPTVARIQPNSTSLCVQVLDSKSTPLVVRFIHGAYILDKGVAYYKASESLGLERPLWSNVNETATQKANKGRKKGTNKKIVLNTIFGGKLTGILVQSFCRELFFDSLALLSERLEEVDNVNIVGQFHDEIVVDWRPGSWSLEKAMEVMEEAMSTCNIEGFPLVADIKHAYRYIK